MEWLIFALFAYLGFAIATIIDGVSIKTYIKNPKTYLFYNTFLQGLVGILIFLFIDYEIYKNCCDSK